MALQSTWGQWPQANANYGSAPTYNTPQQIPSQTTYNPGTTNISLTGGSYSTQPSLGDGKSSVLNPPAMPSAASYINTATPGVDPAAAAQWAQQQQQWQQWQQWQQQYAQWQQQYGDSYQNMANAGAAAATPSAFPMQNVPPLPQGLPAVQPPPPMPETKPPEPPQQPTDTKRPKTKATKESLEELIEAEKQFDEQFRDWEAQFIQWKEQNVNHPDKNQYREYEVRWQTWREQLVQKRDAMKKKRESKEAEIAAMKAELEASSKSVISTSQAPVVYNYPTSRPPALGQMPAFGMMPPNIAPYSYPQIPAMSAMPPFGTPFGQQQQQQQQLQQQQQQQQQPLNPPFANSNDQKSMNDSNYSYPKRAVEDRNPIPVVGSGVGNRQNDWGREGADSYQRGGSGQNDNRPFGTSSGGDSRNQQSNYKDDYDYGGAKNMPPVADASQRKRPSRFTAAEEQQYENTSEKYPRYADDDNRYGSGVGARGGPVGDRSSSGWSSGPRGTGFGNRANESANSPYGGTKGDSDQPYRREETNKWGSGAGARGDTGDSMSWNRGGRKETYEDEMKKTEPSDAAWSKPPPQVSGGGEAWNQNARSRDAWNKGNATSEQKRWGDSRPFKDDYPTEEKKPPGPWLAKGNQASERIESAWGRPPAGPPQNVKGQEQERGPYNAWKQEPDPRPSSFNKGTPDSRPPPFAKEPEQRNNSFNKGTDSRGGDQWSANKGPEQRAPPFSKEPDTRSGNSFNKGMDNRGESEQWSANKGAEQRPPPFNREPDARSSSNAVNKGRDTRGGCDQWSTPPPFGRDTDQRQNAFSKGPEQRPVPFDKGQPQQPPFSKGTPGKIPSLFDMPMMEPPQPMMEPPRPFDAMAAKDNSESGHRFDKPVSGNKTMERPSRDFNKRGEAARNSIQPPPFMQAFDKFGAVGGSSDMSYTKGPPPEIPKPKELPGWSTGPPPTGGILNEQNAISMDPKMMPSQGSPQSFQQQKFESRPPAPFQQMQQPPIFEQRQSLPPRFQQMPSMQQKPQYDGGVNNFEKFNQNELKNDMGQQFGFTGIGPNWSNKPLEVPAAQAIKDAPVQNIVPQKPAEPAVPVLQLPQWKPDPPLTEEKFLDNLTIYQYNHKPATVNGHLMRENLEYSFIYEYNHGKNANIDASKGKLSNEGKAAVETKKDTPHKGGYYQGLTQQGGGTGGRQTPNFQPKSQPTSTSNFQQNKDANMRQNDSNFNAGAKFEGNNAGPKMNAKLDSTGISNVLNKTVETDSAPKPQRTPKSIAKPNKVILVENLISECEKTAHPPKTCVIIRGLPGSGKSHLAKLLKDKDVAFGFRASRILSLDDYFLTEVNKEEVDAVTKRKVKKTTSEYIYDNQMEECYLESLMKAFKKTLENALYQLVIVDANNEKIKKIDEMNAFALSKGYRVYICELEADVKTCVKRNKHKRTEEEISNVQKEWEKIPPSYVLLDVRSLMHDGIVDVEMEDVLNGDVSTDKENPPKDDDEVEVLKIVSTGSANANANPKATLPAQSQSGYVPAQTNSRMPMMRGPRGLPLRGPPPMRGGLPLRGAGPGVGMMAPQRAQWPPRAPMANQWQRGPREFGGPIWRSGWPNRR